MDPNHFLDRPQCAGSGRPNLIVISQNRLRTEYIDLDLASQGAIFLGFARSQLVKHIFECTRLFHSVPLRVLHAKLAQSLDDLGVFRVLRHGPNTKIPGEGYPRFCCHFSRLRSPILRPRQRGRCRKCLIERSFLFAVETTSLPRFSALITPLQQSLCEGRSAAAARRRSRPGSGTHPGD